MNHKEHEEHQGKLAEFFLVVFVSLVVKTTRITSPLSIAAFVGGVLTGCTGQMADVPTTALVGTARAEETSTVIPNTAETLPSSDADDQTLASSEAATDAVAHTVRKEVASESPPEIPGVWLSTEHAALCRVQVGDSFPELTLPGLDSEEAELADLRGKQATVILCWQPDRWMARTALADISRDVVAQYDAAQVSAIGIAVKQPAEAVENAVAEVDATFRQFLDSDGQAFDKLGTITLPRIYVLDATGKIAWFDIEYSESTSRELLQAVAALTDAEE